jgi:hypothetical protein
MIVRRGSRFVPRQIRFDGVFCRDCAVAGGGYDKASAAVAAADLPDEVKDDRWIWHKVTCPRCRASAFAPAGPVRCDECDCEFVVVSCGACGAVHVIATQAATFNVSILGCRLCGQPSAAPVPVRNWSIMLIGQAIVEVAAEVLKPERSVSRAERRFLTDTLQDFPEISPEVVRVLEGYFERCLLGESTDALPGCVAHCKRHFRKVLLSIAVAIAESDGPLSGQRWQALRRVTGKLGLDPDVELRGKRPLDVSPPLAGDDTCWAILELPSRASIADIKTAYRREARKHHPDRLYNASPQAQVAAEVRMKAINAAFADALTAMSITAPTNADERQHRSASDLRQPKKHFASKWVAVSGRPPYAVSGVAVLQKPQRFARRTVLRLAGLLILGLVSRYVVGFVMSSTPTLANDPANDTILFASPACIVAVAAALVWGGMRAAVYTMVVLAFAVIAVLWYQGLTKAIEYERRHAREMNQFESNSR